MPYAALTAGLKARVETVTDVGMVHAYQRYSVEMAKYLDQFKAKIGGVDQIRGWVITLDPSDPILSERIESTVTERVYRYQIFGVMNLRDDANTEGTFIELAEAVMNAAEGQVSLGATGVFLVEAPSMRIYQLRMFGSVLCHYCEISVPVRTDLGVNWGG